MKQKKEPKFSILFVCMGNICRSPAAQGIMRQKLNEVSWGDEIFLDSAGTTQYHTGSFSDARMCHYASLRNYDIRKISRKFDDVSDFISFDLILAMDNKNFLDLRSFDEKNKYQSKIKMMTYFCQKSNFVEVPDPYYDGEKGFDLVLDILEDATQGLLLFLKEKINSD